MDGATDDISHPDLNNFRPDSPYSDNANVMGIALIAVAFAVIFATFIG